MTMPSSHHPTLALIGLGSNLGDRKAHLDAAIDALRATPCIVVRAVSTYHETTPVGGPAGQGTYLNAAVAVVTTLEPTTLLGALEQIEKTRGRVRSVHWGARTLDLDLLLFGEQIIDTPELEVPHPRLAVRRFVLGPLCEIAPDAVDPLTRRSVAQLLANLDRRPSYVALSQFWDAPRSLGPIFEQVVARLGAVSIGGLTDSMHGSLRDHLLSLSYDDAEILLERWTRELRVERWRDLGERWLVTDFWFDSALAFGPQHPVEHRRGVSVFEKFASAVRQVVAPTFVVFPHQRTFKRRMAPQPPSTAPQPLSSAALSLTPEHPATPCPTSSDTIEIVPEPPAAGAASRTS